MKELSFTQLFARYSLLVREWHRLRTSLPLDQLINEQDRILNMHKQITRRMQIDQLCSQAGVSLIRK